MPIALRGRQKKLAIADANSIPATDRERAEGWWEEQGQFDTRRISIQDEWYSYDGTRWAPHGSKETGVQRSVGKYLGALSDAVWELLPTVPDKERATLREIRAGLESSITTNNTVAWVRRLDSLYVSEGYFDPPESRYLLNCANGTLDLRDKTFRPFDPDDRLTGLAPTPYDPAAKAPDWEKFIKEILREKEVRQYVQRVLGMSLLGDPGVQGAWVFHGTGANGKGSLMRTVMRVLGHDYSSVVPRSTLQQTKREEHPTAFLEFRGRRLTLLDEFPASASFSEHSFKELTGGGDITARGMRQDYITFRPTHTLIITTNNLPEVSEDPAMWRRLHLIPFKVEIPPEKRDENRELRIFKDEASGVLNWLVEGFQDFWERSDRGAGPGRLDAPEAVIEATEAWHTGQDHLAQFLAQHVTQAVGSGTRTEELRSLYVKWCQEQDISFATRINSTSFTPELVKRKYEVKKDHRLNGVKGTWLMDWTLKTENVQPVSSAVSEAVICSSQSTTEQAF